MPPLGINLKTLESFFADKPKYFINTKILHHFTKLMVELRNEVSHSTLHTDRKEVIEIQSYLSFHLALTFLKFTIKTMSGFLDKDGKLLNITEFSEPLPETEDTIFYFGFDGDSTGKYLEIAFGDLEEDEAEVLKRSQQVFEAIKSIKKLICKATGQEKSVIFAQGDNVLFKGVYNISLLNNIQKTYREKTGGLSSSIGYGKTLKETTVAMRLAKEQQGDSIVGISLK